MICKTKGCNRDYPEEMMLHGHCEKCWEYVHDWNVEHAGEEND